MRLQEAVEVVPNPRDPIDDLHQLHVACAAADLCLNQLSPQVAPQEAFHRLHVVGTQHPPDQGAERRVRNTDLKLDRRAEDIGKGLPEVVVKLKIGRR